MIETDEMRGYSFSFDLHLFEGYGLEIAGIGGLGTGEIGGGEKGMEDISYGLPIFYFASLLSFNLFFDFGLRVPSMRF